MEHEVQYVINIRVEELAKELLSRNRLKGSLVDIQLRGDLVSLYFRPADIKESSREEKAALQHSANVISDSHAELVRIKKRRRTGRRRNRMRTRGWTVVGKVKNEYGQNSNVYRPFVDALSEKDYEPAEQRAIVARILRANKNDPSEESIDYFLNNALQFMLEQDAGTKAKKSR